LEVDAMKTHLLIVALALLNGSINARGWVFPECTIDPPNPTSADAFTFTFGGIWFDTCVPDHLSVEVVESSIKVDVHIQPEIPVCFDAETPWTLSETIGPLPSGTYTVLGTLYHFDDPEPWYVDTPICDIVVSESEPAGTPVGGLICEDTTWTAKDGPYCVTSSIVVGCGATLTIEPGVHICFPRGQLGLAVGSGAFGVGTLVARGTSEAPITFTSCEPDAAPGDWVSINFTSFATSAVFDESDEYVSGSILEHVIVEYAGAGDGFGAVRADESSRYIARSIIRYNANTGVVLWKSEAPRLENNIISDNTGTQGGGVFIWNSPGAMVIGNTITGNENSNFYSGGISIELSDAPTLISNTITGNTGGEVGGLYIVRGHNLQLIDNMIEGNDGGDSQGSGGAYLYQCNSAKVEGNTISGNTSWLGNGAGPGGLSLEGSSATIHNNLISDNIGGAGARVVSAMASISNNEISGNEGWGAGGLTVSGDFATLTGNHIANNSAYFDRGGVSIFNSDSVVVTDNVITNNSILFGIVGGGGGIYVRGCPNAVVDNNVISGNSAGGTSAQGGGVLVLSSPYVTLMHNTINDNLAGRDGGGVYLDFSFAPTIVGNVIRNNTARDFMGGGIGVFGSFAAELTDNVVIGNRSVYNGGIKLTWSDSSTLAGNIVIRNTAEMGAGGIHVGSADCTIADNVFANNIGWGPDGRGGVSFMSDNIGLAFAGAEQGAASVLLGNSGFDVLVVAGFSPIDNDVVAGNVWWGTQNAQAIESRI
jgi:parallel beta-helix repeat protein